MTKASLPALFLSAALLSLGGCGGSAHNEQAEAGATITADPNATMAEATKDVDAASDQAIGGNEAGGNAQEFGGNISEIED